MRVLVLGIVFALGCGHTANPEDPVAVVAVPLSDLGPGDVFEVRVYGEEDLSGEYRVSSDGNINFPLVGKLGVDGKTATEISDEISARLTKFIKDPSVSVFVKEYQSKKVYVYGRVQKAGTFPYEDGMNIIQAITLAGAASTNS